MKLKYILCVVALIATSKSSFAQYAKDAIRYSTFGTGSTSRIKGIGNAGTAVGGDLSSVSGNPAGLGFFTMSEVSLTPEFDGSKSNSIYLNQPGAASKNNLNLSNAAIVFYSRLNTPSGQDKTKGWLSLNFGMGYNRTNNFDERISYGAKNSNSSINDYYASLANSSGVDAGTLQGWAYGQNLIDQYGSTTTPTYKSNAYPGVNQLNSITRSGGQSEFDLSLGANYSNKLYLGFGIGITQLRYNSANSFNEIGTASVLEGSSTTGVDRNFNSTFTQSQDTKGEGFNAKFGFIYKLLENVRLGATVTTPTYITIDDSYSEGLASSFNNGSNYVDGPADYPLTYKMRTPLKASGGLSVFFGKYGFISGDVEYIDYSTTRISSNDNYLADYDNGIIKSNYHAAVNAHVGAEIKLIGSVALRGGYGIQGSPLKTNGTQTKTATAGLGYRFGSYYVDAAYVHVTGSQTITPYDVGTLTPTASVNGTNNNVFVTVGYRY
ncbi:hypothetical protein [Mucilaginibacter sp.]|uniref:OmpP1/FadL family transporter n=1 Tax=Mucilaginibacter sp. TaxID=1882438 RepID=UPI00261694FB|nr:hypothetical protein [Mucilaginibacter sp.]MDB5029649.1 hypothetical protein [Mucilaginibacter sp.]